MFCFFYQSLSRLPRWVHVVQIPRTKSSHAWAPWRQITPEYLYVISPIRPGIIFCAIYSTVQYFLGVQIFMRNFCVASKGFCIVQGWIVFTSVSNIMQTLRCSLRWLNDFMRMINLLYLLLYSILCHTGTALTPFKAKLSRNAVKSSNFVTLLDENIFFRKTFITSPHNFFGIEICTDGA